MSADGSGSSVPSAQELLNSVKGESVNGLIRRGTRGLIQGVALFILAVVTGFVDITTEFFDTLGFAAGDIPLAVFTGIRNVIQRGFALTLGSFLDLGPLGFVEGLAYAFVTLVLIQQMMDFFDTDIFTLPGFSAIPFFGVDADGDDN